MGEAAMLSLALSSPNPSSLYRDPFRCLLPAPRPQSKLFSLVNDTYLTNYCFLPLRFSQTHHRLKKKMRGSGAVCYSAPLTTLNLQWVCTISSAILLLARGTAVQKSFLVPLFALQAPKSIISWIKGEYGTWTAFLALLVRLFFFIPGELELPFVALLLVIVAPYQVMDLRGTQAGAIISLVIAGFLAFQHFSWVGRLRAAFDQVSIVATLTVICITVVSCLLLI